VEQGEYLGLAVLLMLTYWLKRSRTRALHSQAASVNQAMRRGYRVLPKTHFRSFAEVMRKAGESLRGNLASEVLFCFAGLRFQVFSPYRDGRYCGAPKPGKEKQKSYNYCCAILMVHSFDPSSLCSPR
jgi:hypothetical protein